MSKRNEEDSSLELLLDTMCNTFGGVMFIAIALVVTMSMLTNADPAEMAEKESQAVILENQKLQDELKKLNRRNAEQEKLLADLENDPRREKIAELMKLEKILAENQLLQTLEKQKVRVEKTLLQKEQTKLRELEQRYAKLAKETEKRKKDIRLLAEKLSKMNQDLASSQATSMTFRIMEQSSNMPYYLILAHGRVWKVGPEQNSGKLLPHQDVSFHESAQKNGDTAFSCRPVPGKGVLLLKGQTLSPEFLQLLSEIPGNRSPIFSIAKDSIKEFCILRKYLTQQKILHGTDTEFEFKGCVNYSMTNRRNVQYEYY